MSQINTNTYSLNAQRNLAKNSLGLASAMERLSSGLRVNSAKDDASGLAVGMAKESSARTTAVQIRQAQDAISAAQIKDGALGVVGDIVLRIKELNDMAGSSLGTSEYAAEASALAATANDIIAKATAAAGNSALSSTITISSVITDNAALTSVTNERAFQGAVMNNEEFNIQSLRVNYENQQAARSRIMDADFAEETSRLSRFQVLQQAGTAMVAQANAIPQNVLSLLR